MENSADPIKYESVNPVHRINHWSSRGSYIYTINIIH